ncbi:MAG TPA: BatD family protein [Woeseiaceae bacterium]|nr:BatD family protein [Woeseiaceae bacterium]
MRARVLAAAAAALLSLAIPAQQAFASVVARLDRSDVELNESFTLDVTVDTEIDTEPDVSALERDFYILSRSELRNTTIINGQINRNRTWTYVLMAKEAGQFVIPPIAVGNEQSEPLLVVISPVEDVLPGESDVYVVSEVDYRETYVQAQVLYRIKVYRAVATRQPRLSQPDISGVDVLVELAADERSYDSIIDGKNYNVVERVYALFPQASGELSIAPAIFEARVLRDGRITGRKIFKSEPISIEVRPIPPPPPDYPNAAWFPAKSVELAEEWSHEPANLTAGEPVTRRITVTALGQLSTQIPVIEPVEPAGVKLYPDKPELRVTPVAGGIEATRRDQYALIAVDPGTIRLPAVELPWWNIETGAWEVASLPPQTLAIAPSADALPGPAEIAAATAEEAPGASPVEPAVWRPVAFALGAAWLGTLLLWWRSRRAPNATGSALPKAVSARKLKAAYLRSARQAALRGDAAAAKSSLLEWARFEWPAQAPRSMAGIAARVAEPLASELRRLCETSYGPGSRSWDGAGLADALRSVQVQQERGAPTADVLPPLMPRT